MKKITLLMLSAALLVPMTLSAQPVTSKNVINPNVRVNKTLTAPKPTKPVMLTAPKAEVPDGYASVTLTAGNVWDDGSGYQMLLDADATAYGTIIPTTGGLTTSGDASAATYAEFEYKIPENADGALTTANIVLDNSVSILIPAGTYDWCITNPSPGDRVWIASANGTVGGRYDNFEFASGVSYEFVVSLGTTNDQVDLVVIDPTAPEIPTNLTADPTATTAKIAWEAGANNASYNLRYREYVEVGEAASWNFDQSTLDGWTTIDADGDGYNWILGSTVGGVYLVEGGSLAGNGHNSSQDLVVSASYSNVVGALSPDNYLVSPKVQLGGAITFWAKGQDVNYAAETFGVAVSTAGNTNAADFTMVGEQKTSTGDWVQYEFDLSAYAGQEGYVAIRHYGISDMFILDVDDIEILPPGNEWIYVNDVTENPYTIEGLTPETTYEVQVQGVAADDRASDWTESVIFTTLEETEEPVKYYVTGGFNSWTETEPLEITEEGATFTVIAQNFEDTEDTAQEFKIITFDEDGSTIWIGGTDEAGVHHFDITNEMLGEEISLYVNDETTPNYANFRLPAAGNYTVKLVDDEEGNGKGLVEGLKMVVLLNESPAVGVADINAKAVKSVKYVNLAGVESNKPFDGVNIMVTTYTDGTKAAAKVIK